MPSDFFTLAAYQRSRKLADDVYEAVARWAPFQRDSLGNQLVRAAYSVPANIAEAAGRWTPADKRRYLLIARGSLYETEHWLDAASAHGLIARDFCDRVASIARPLNGMLKQPAPR